jgi:hypothetical protein
MIGHAREWDGLYYLEAPSKSGITNGKLSHSFVSKKFNVSADVTFNEQESYFTTPYLQGESSIMEDKDREDMDFFS